MSLFDRTPARFHPAFEEDYEPFDVKVACPRGHETRWVTIYHPSDEHYCTTCGERMPGEFV